MKHEDPLHDAFIVLDPPLGGWFALQARLRARNRRRAGWTLAAVAAAACVAVFVLVPRSVALPEAMAHDPTVLALTGASPAGTVVVAPGAGARMALERVPLPGDAVVYYRVVGWDVGG